MALIKCPECGSFKSDSARRCPHCGAKKPYTPWKQNLIAVFLIATVALIVYSISQSV